MNRSSYLLALAAMVVAPAPARTESKAMEPGVGPHLTVERLGDVGPASSTGSWRSSRAVEPMPIILWRGQEIAAALYYEWHGNGILGRYSQKIASADTQEKTRPAPLGSDYPIKFSGRVDGERGESAIAAIDIAHLEAADLDGDGTDDLVVPRHQGGVDIYTLRGRAHSWAAPGGAPKYYAHEVVSVYKARARGRESVYFVFRRKAYRDADVPSKVAKLAESFPTETLVEASAGGVRQVSLRGLPGRVVQIAGVALLDRPKPGQADELVVCTRLEGREGVYLSRHSLQGDLLGEVREIYAEIGGGSRLQFSFLPQSDLLVATGDSTPFVAFIWPDKLVNWFKMVRLGDEWRADDPLLFRGMVDRKSASPKALFQQGVKLFVIDQDGVCHKNEGGKYIAVGPKEQEKIVPWLVVEATSPQHRLAQIKLLDGDDDAVLVLETRVPGTKKLSLDELRAAAKQFLPPEFLEKAEAKYAPTFEHLYDEELLGPKASSPMQTIEDLKAQKPKFYEYQLASLQSQLGVTLEVELLLPLNQDVDVAEPTYRRIQEYRAWLASLGYDAETHLRVISPRGVELDRTLATTLIYTTGPSPGIPHKWVVAKRYGKRLRLVLPLVRDEPQGVVSGFYLVSAS